VCTIKQFLLPGKHFPVILVNLILGRVVNFGTHDWVSKADCHWNPPWRPQKPSKTTKKGGQGCLKHIGELFQNSKGIYNNCIEGCVSKEAIHWNNGGTRSQCNFDNSLALFQIGSFFVARLMKHMPAIPVCKSHDSHILLFFVCVFSLHLVGARS
jgi:hypothetical protein